MGPYLDVLGYYFGLESVDGVHDLLDQLSEGSVVDWFVHRYDPYYGLRQASVGVFAGSCELIGLGCSSATRWKMARREVERQLRLFGVGDLSSLGEEEGSADAGGDSDERWNEVCRHLGRLLREEGFEDFLARLRRDAGASDGP